MAELKKASVKKKSAVQEFEGHVKDIRQQFAEQLRCLEGRTDVEVALLSEIQEYFKKRADVELEYSRNLEKLAKQISAKHKAEKQKREVWPLFSLYSWWQQLINETKMEARYRSVVADVYVNYAATKMSNQADELLRISKRCREIGSAAHQEILRVLGELHTAMKTYQLCYAASRVAETKFRTIEAQKIRFEESNPKKVGNRKHRLLEREFEKKQAKYLEFKLKALKARNEYLLCIDAANAALHKYFADDLSDLIDCMDVGMEQSLRSLVSTVLDARRRVVDTETKHVDANRSWLQDLDARSDKRRFLEANHSTFMLPRKFEFRPHNGDEVRDVLAQNQVQEELIQRYGQLQRRLRELKTENEEIWKTYSMAERKLMEIQRLPELKTHELFDPTSSPPPHATASTSSVLCNASALATGVISSTMGSVSSGSEPVTPRRNSCREPEAAQQKRKMDLCEMEEYLLQKFHQYLLTCNLIHRLEARHDAIETSLGISPAPGESGRLISNGHGGFGGYAVVRDVSSHSLSSSTVTEQAGLDAGAGMTDSTTALLCSSTTTQHSQSVCVAPKPRKKRVGQTAPAIHHRPRLFGGSLEEYVEMAGEEIPLIIRSCVRMLSLFGLHHQGVFRVSGSQIEINAFKDAFERGEDPLADVTDASDVNSVAGVLKLYFRELREPLFPIFMFDQFVECTRCESKQETVEKINDLVRTLPRPVYVVMRYLFAFLSHLSEFSDENMMDPYNLAICFGPTLLPIPESRDQVFFHNHVNELVKNMIVHHEEIFPKVDSLGGIVYEKYLLTDSATGDVTNDEDEGAEDDAAGESGGRTGITNSQEDLMANNPSPPWEVDRLSGAEPKGGNIEATNMVRTQSDLSLSSHHLGSKEADSPGQTHSDGSGEKKQDRPVWLRRADGGIRKSADKQTEGGDIGSETTREHDAQTAPSHSAFGHVGIKNVWKGESEKAELVARWTPKCYDHGALEKSQEISVATRGCMNMNRDGGSSYSTSINPSSFPFRTPLVPPTSTHGYGVAARSYRAAPLVTTDTNTSNLLAATDTRHHSATEDAGSPTAFRRDGVTVPLKRLSLSSYGIPPISTVGQTIHFDAGPASAALEPDQEQYCYQYPDLELVRPTSCHPQHQLPKGLSPTSLKEIQVELKAVLNSLETFTMQHQTRLNGSSGSKEAPVILSSPKALVVSSPVTPPDLVQNLPSPKEDSGSPTMKASVSSSAGASTTHDSNAFGLVSAAERFAENKENTLKKGIPTTTTQPQHGHSLIRKQASFDQATQSGAGATNPRAKPPVPRKPSVGQIRPSMSPQMSYQRRLDNPDDCSEDSDL